MQKHTLTIMGSTISYWVKNPRRTETIVMVHGFRGNHKALTRMTAHLKDYRVILVDLPGYGQSTPMRCTHTIEHYQEVLEEFCSRLRLRSFCLWGHSFGGTIALRFAARTKHSLTHLVLVSPAVLTRGFLTNLGAWYYRIAEMLPATLRRVWLANRLFCTLSGMVMIKVASAHRRQELIAAGLRDLKEYNDSVIMQSFRSFYSSNVLRWANSIRRPTLVIAGDRDELVPLTRLRRLSSCLPKGSLVVLKGEGHLSPLEQPQHVATLTQHFLTRKQSHLTRVIRPMQQSLTLSTTAA